MLNNKKFLKWLIVADSILLAISCLLIFANVNSDVGVFVFTTCDILLAKKYYSLEDDNMDNGR